MIFVTLGTQDKPFNRLVEAVEKQIERGTIQEEVIAQVGCTKFSSDKMKVIDYVQMEEFDQLMDKADLIITHAGVGSIIAGLEKHKKMIVAAREKVYGEHVNNHQEQILENFSHRGYIIPLIEFEELDEALKQAKKFVPQEFTSNNRHFINCLTEEIETLINQ